MSYESLCLMTNGLNVAKTVNENGNREQIRRCAAVVIVVVVAQRTVFLLLLLTSTTTSIRSRDQQT